VRFKVPASQLISGLQEAYVFLAVGAITTTGGARTAFVPALRVLLCQRVFTYN
jgi:hypothetical protein